MSDLSEKLAGLRHYLMTVEEEDEAPEVAYARGVADALKSVAHSYEQLLRKALVPSFWNVGRQTVAFWKDRAEKAQVVYEARRKSRERRVSRETCSP